MKIRKIVEKIGQSLMNDSKRWKYSQYFLSDILEYSIYSIEDKKYCFCCRLTNNVSCFGGGKCSISTIDINESCLILTDDEKNYISGLFANLVLIKRPQYIKEQKEEQLKALSKNINLALKEFGN